MLKLTAKAKINLGLAITGKREDGYHLLKSVFLEIPLSDTLFLEKSGTKETTLTCTEPDLSCGEDNLCMKAARLMEKHYGLTEGVKMHLVKEIPSQAGLGGGSADAAAVMKGMNTAFSLNAPAEELENLAASLGADVPFFIRGGCALAEGIGEKLTALPVPSGFFLLLARPAAGADTGKIYRLYDGLERKAEPDVEAMIAGIRANDPVAMAKGAVNALEEAAAGLVPEIGRLRSLLEETGPAFVQMTGSGSCVFAVYREKEKALRAEESLPAGFWHKVLAL